MRRVWSIAWLTFREAVHNKVLLSCAFFAAMLVLVRVGVFAVGGSELWVTVEQYTRIALGLMLLTGVVVSIVQAAPSLSQDIRSKVIHTIVPKPIHRVEILLGKVLGFAAVAGLILAVMGALTVGVSLATIRHRIPERNRDTFAAEVRLPPTSIRFSGGFLSGMKRSTRRWINPDVPDTMDATVAGLPASPTKFTPGEALVTFENLTRRVVGRGPLRFVLDVGVYRYGGGAGGNPELSLTIINRDTGERRLAGRSGVTDTEHKPFTIVEGVPEVVEVSDPAFFGDGATIDLLIRNLTPKDRIGIKRTDVMLLSGDRSYLANFVKALYILFLEVFVVIVIAVMSSTFLSGPIAIFFTSVVWFSGHLIGWVSSLLTSYIGPGEGPMTAIGKEFGRDPFFAPVGAFDWVMDFVNAIFKGVLSLAAHLFPNLGQFDGAWLAAQNVAISAGTVWRATQFALLYSAICFVVAYVVFRAKEVAR